MKKKSIILKIAFTFIAAFSVIAITNAANLNFIETKLSIGRGASHTGESRDLYKGEHNILMSVEYNGLYFNSDETFSKIEVLYQENLDIACRLVGTVVHRVEYKPDSYDADWGQQPAGNYNYHFTTRVNNHNYPGMYFHYVLIRVEI